MKLYSRLVLGDLKKESDPKGLIESAVRSGLRALESSGTPAWDTLRVTIQLDDDIVNEHVLTITALEV